MIVLWSLGLLAALLITLAASHRAVTEIRKFALEIRVPPFFVGLTLVAIGTDLPEIANSIIASIAQHGDLNVGDSVGSAATQITLVLGLLPFLCGSFKVERRQAVLAGSLTTAALLLGVLLVADARLSRLDGIVLLTAWALASALVWKYSPPSSAPPVEPPDKGGHHAIKSLFFLALVGAGATGAVVAFIQLSELLGVPEYLISFFATSIGTSLPELIVDVGAIRRKATNIAVGDLFGSSLVDATLSLGAGPIVAATSISAGLAIRGGLAAATIVCLVTLLFWRVREHDWRSGLILLLLYAAFYPMLLWR